MTPSIRLRIAIAATVAATSIGVAVGVAAPVQAQPSTVRASVDDNVLKILGGPGGDNLTLSGNESGASATVTVRSNVRLLAGRGCTYVGLNVARCSSVSRVIALLGAGDDTFTNDTVRFSQLSGETGNDRLYGGLGRVDLTGGDGDDDLRGNGGPAPVHDYAYGGAGNDFCTADGVFDCEMGAR